MIDRNVIAVGGAIGGNGNSAAVGCYDLSARLGAYVYAGMRSLVPEEGVFTHAELAGNIGAGGAGPDVGTRCG